MKLEIILRAEGYCLRLDNIINDKEIANRLNISIDNFKEILERHHAYNTHNLCYFFKNKEDAEKAIEELEAHLVMGKLMGD